MATTPNLQLIVMESGQAQKHVTFNEALRELDAVVQLSVLDRDLTAPPASPAEGDRYLVAASATDEWAGWDDDIAAYIDGAWMRFVVRTGWRLYVEDEETMLLRQASGFAEFAFGAASKASTAEILDGTANKYVDPAGIDSALAPVTLTDAASIAWDMDTGRNFEVTLTDNRTMAAPSNITAGRSGVLRVTQDGTGSRTLTWNSAFEFVDGTAPTLSTTAGETDTFSYFCPDGSTVQIAHIGVFS